MAQHARLKIEAGVRVDPRISQPMAPGTERETLTDCCARVLLQRDRSQHAQRQRTAAVAAALNARP